MKKFLISSIAIFTFALSTPVHSQGYSRAVIESIWGQRSWPSKTDIDSTFNSLPTFINNGYAGVVDTFMLANTGSLAWQDTVAASRYTRSINVRDTVQFAGGGSTTLPATLFRPVANGEDSQIFAYNNWFRYTPGINFPSPTIFKIQGWVFMTDTLSTVKFTLYGQGFKSVKLHVPSINTWVYFSEAFPAPFTFTKSEDLMFTMKILLSNHSSSKIYLNGVKLKVYS